MRPIVNTTLAPTADMGMHARFMHEVYYKYSKYTSYLGHNKIIEGVVVWQYQVLLDIHELVCRDCLQLTKLWSQRVQAPL